MATAQLQIEVTYIISFKKRVVKNATLSFWYIHFGNFNINFVENFMKKSFLGRKPSLRQFSKVLLKFYHVIIFKDLSIFDSKMAAIIIAYFEDVIVFWVQP